MKWSGLDFGNKKKNEEKDVFRLSFLNDLFWLRRSGVVCIPNVLQLVRYEAVGPMCTE